MIYGFYLREGMVYVPTLAKVLTGGHQEIDPVLVVSASNTAELKRALLEMILQGNPVIPSYSYENNPPPVVLKHAGLKSYAAFARGALSWLIEERDGVCRIIGQRKLPRRGWVDDPDQIVTLPDGSSVDEIVDRAVAIVQAADGHPKFVCP